MEQLPSGHGSGIASGLGTAPLDVRAGHAADPDTDEALAHLTAQLARPGRPDPALLLVFASPRQDIAKVTRQLKHTFPGSLLVGCTTMGEIGIAGWTSGGVSALALGGPGLEAAAAVIEDVRSAHAETTSEAVRAACGRLGTAPERAAADGCFGVTLTDGLSGAEELLLARVGAEIIGMPCVGGSAADDFALEQTAIFHEDRALPSSAVFVVVRCPTPFRPFRTQHFRPMTRHVVVTGADPLRRRLTELDGWPAIQVLADIVGVSADELRRAPMEVFHRARRSIAFYAGGEVMLRSVMSVDGNDVVMGGAVDEGVVLTVMEAGDLLADTRLAMATLRADLGDVAAMLQFNCGGRQFEARALGIEAQVADATLVAPTAGFHTYGEQYGCLHVNETLTGIAIARSTPEAGA